MVSPPRQRQPSPRKRLPPMPFNQTWHETDAAHLDPTALPVGRVPRGWERKCEVKQVSEGKAKSIWRRFSLRSSIVNEPEEDGTDEDDHDALSRAVKRRQKLSPKAMEKIHGNKRAFEGTRWESGMSVLRRKQSAHADKTLHEEQSDGSDTPDTTDADMNHESLDVSHGLSSFTFAKDMAQTADELPDYESLEEQEDDQKLGNILPEDSTFALIFRTPVKHTSTTQSSSPAKVAHGTLPHHLEKDELPEILTKQAEKEDNTVKGPTNESVVVEVAAKAPTAATFVDRNEVPVSREDRHTGGSAPQIETASKELVELPTVEQASPHNEDADNLAYPELPTDHHLETHTGKAQAADEGSKDDEDDSEMSEVDLGTFRSSSHSGKVKVASLDKELDVTEASLQLDIQEEYELEGELASEPSTPRPAAGGVHDIADGLTLSATPAQPPSREYTSKKLHSPPPPLRIESGPEDATMTLAIDDDTAILKSFLSRAAASKAERSAIITRRSSLENRRDSDVVRHALASPRKALEEMDPNSPIKIDGESAFDLTEMPVQQMDMEESATSSIEQVESEDPADKSGRGSRRSSRAKKSRLPAPATAAQAPTTNKIAIRRADGSDPVVLKKTDAQELALITRNNTRKNKQGAFMVSLRLLKLQAEAILSPCTDLDAEEKPTVPGRRGISWDETLAYYQEHADTIASQQAEAESLATPDELSLPEPAATKKLKAKARTDKDSTSKNRRVRGLGTANGTPGKALLATASLLPDSVQEEKIAVAAQPTAPPASKSLPKPKASKKSSFTFTPISTKLPALEIMPVGVEPVKERKSRIAAPKNVRLPKPMAVKTPILAATPVAEKENKRMGISGATPRKGIPAPRVVAPKTATPAPAANQGVESALPRRRGRKI